jgi:hypothetical protein
VTVSWSARLTTRSGKPDKSVIKASTRMVPPPDAARSAHPAWPVTLFTARGVAHGAYAATDVRIARTSVVDGSAPTERAVTNLSVKAQSPGALTPMPGIRQLHPEISRPTILERRLEDSFEDLEPGSWGSAGSWSASGG